MAQGTEESWIKVGYTRNCVIEDRRTVRDGTVSLAKRTTCSLRRRCSLRGTRMGDPAVVDEDTVDDEDAFEGEDAEQVVAEDCSDPRDDD